MLNLTPLLANIPGFDLAFILPVPVVVAAALAEPAEAAVDEALKKLELIQLDWHAA